MTTTFFNTKFFYSLLIWLVLLLGFIGSGAVSYWVKLDIDALQHQQFLYYCEEIKLKIVARLKAHEQTLVASAGLFEASDSVTRNEWRGYATRLLINNHFNGIQGIGFIPWVPHEQLAAHIAHVRADGFPNYTVRPEGDRETYAPIEFIELFNERNIRAFGYDVYSEPVRRVGAERARDENIVTLTGKIILVQETDKDIQAGLLMYAPVYQKNKPIDTVEQRRAALFGWTYSPFRMNDLFNNIMLPVQNTDITHLYLRIYDGSDSQAELLLYDNSPHRADHDIQGIHSVVKLSSNFNGTVWILQFEQITAVNNLYYFRAWITLITGIVVSVLIFLLLRSYLNTRINAINIAAKLTAQLQKSESRFRIFADNAPVMVWLADLDKLCYQFNKVWLDFTGRTLDQEYGNGWAEGVLPEDLQNCLDIYISSFDAHLPFKMEYRLRRYDGEYRWILNNGMPRFSDNGIFLGYIGSCIDITDKKQMEQALQIESEKNLALLRNASDGIHILNAEGNIIEASDSFCIMLGYQREEVIGMNVSQWDVHFSPSERIETLKKLFESRVRYLFETRHLCKDGIIIDVEVSSYSLELNGELVLFNSSRDITERKQMSAKLRESELHLRAIIENEPECIKTVDNQGRLLHMNPAGLAMIEADSLEQVVGCAILDIVVPEHRLAFAEMHKRVIAGERQQLEFEIIGFKGGRRWMETHAVPLVEYGEIVTLAVTRDITERKASEQAIHELAFYDPLTGLPNRRKLSDRLNYAIQINRRANTKFAVFMMDLDKFKAVNDSFGHTAGDDLLKQVSERITRCLRGSDMVARLGGDEFVLVLENIKIPEDAETIALKIIAELTIPFQLSKNDTVQISASIGISIYPQHGDTVEKLMDHADNALYRAKDSGRGCFSYFSENM